MPKDNYDKAQKTIKGAYAAPLLRRCNCIGFDRKKLKPRNRLELPLLGQNITIRIRKYVSHDMKAWVVKFAEWPKQNMSCNFWV